MCKAASLLAIAFSLAASSAFGQVIVTSRPVVTTYYAPAVAPAPVVTYYSPAVTLPAPTVTVSPAPVTTYYAPAPVTTLYAPTTTYYSEPVIVRPVAVGTSAYGTVRAYVPGQPVRNTIRFLVP